MKIALISTPFVPVPPNGYGGTELIVYELAEGLVDRKHDVTVYTTGGSHTRARVRARYQEPRWPPDPVTELNHAAWAFRDISREGGYDVVHVHSIAAIPFGDYVDAPLACTLHNERTEPYSDLYRSHQDVHYVAISEDQRRRCSPLTRCSVIHHGVSPEPYHGPTEDEGFVSFIGRISWVKGPDTAITVAERAGLPIQVAGEVHPPDQAFAETEVLPRLAQPHVRYLGPVGLEEKARMLRGARALLVPIRWNEPFGLILIEAMMAGCPVVAFPRGSVPELVEPGLTGFVVQSAEDMVDLVRPGGVLDAFDRQACRDRAVERFGRDRMVLEYERLYRRLRVDRSNRYGRPEPAKPGQRRRLGT